MRHLASFSGLASLIIFVCIYVFGSFNYPGYNHLGQFISELGANGAPTHKVVSTGFIASGLLLVLFWLTALLSLSKKPLAIIGFGFLALNGMGLFFGGVFPCDFECPVEDMSATSLLHTLLGSIGYLAGLIGMLLVALSARRWSHHRFLFPLGLACFAPALIGFSMLDPSFIWHGAAQRTLELAFATFTLGVTLALYRDQNPPT